MGTCLQTITELGSNRTRSWGMSLVTCTETVIKCQKLHTVQGGVIIKTTDALVNAAELHTWRLLSCCVNFTSELCLSCWVAVYSLHVTVSGFSCLLSSGGVRGAGVWPRGGLLSRSLVGFMLGKRQCQSFLGFSVWLVTFPIKGSKNLQQALGPYLPAPGSWAAGQNTRVIF